MSSKIEESIIYTSILIPLSMLLIGYLLYQPQFQNEFSTVDLLGMTALLVIFVSYILATSLSHLEIQQFAFIDGINIDCEILRFKNRVFSVIIMAISTLAIHLVGLTVFTALIFISSFIWFILLYKPTIEFISNILNNSSNK